MLLTHQFCYICKIETAHHDGKCTACSQREDNEQRTKHFKELDSMTLEQRVRRIEEYLYEEAIKPSQIFDF